MARTHMPVDRKVLESLFVKAEASGPLANQSVLFAKVMEMYNMQVPLKPITAAVVRSRCMEWKLKIQTQPGKRGRAAGVALTPEQKSAMLAGRKGRKARLAASPTAQETFEALEKRTPERYLNLLQRAKNGSRTAAQNFNCLSCANFQIQEIRHCPCVTTCIFHPTRPYQKDDQEEEIMEEEVVGDAA